MTSKTIADEYPTLYHYTDWGGLEGMLRTNELWATHIRYMNDESEYIHAKEFLDRHLPENWTEIIYNTNKAANIEIFVSSFCGEPCDPYIKRNGLLSQWRAYGNKQGFLLVFDTEKLDEMLRCELKTFGNSAPHLSDVVYSHDHDAMKSELCGYVQTLKDFVDKRKKGGTTHDEDSAAFSAFFYVTTRYKHRGFAEEREVRLVVSPSVHTNEHLENCKGGIPELPEKKIDLRNGRFGVTPYIKLFGGKLPIPINKIVVGPHKDKKKTAEALRKSPLICKFPDITIEVSEIPYV